jgi:hypothetical protein
MQTSDVAQRERLFTMRMNDEEQARLNDLAKHYAISVAAVLRMLVKERHDQVAVRRASGELPAESSGPVTPKRKKS